MPAPNASARVVPVALVTGASAGIGVAVAEAFVARGYAVGIVGRCAERLDEVRRIDRIPVLGTGKTDHAALRRLITAKKSGPVPVDIGPDGPEHWIG